MILRTPEDFREYERNNKYISHNNIHICSVSEEGAEIRLDIRPESCNVTGHVHGGMLMTLVEKSGGINFEMPFALAYSGLDDTLLRKYIADSASLYDGKADTLPVHTIGSTIGTHVGPGAIAVAFFSNN